MATPDPMLPLFNLSILGQKMESLRQFISDSVSTNTSISADDLQTISTEIASTIRHTILNGAALIASSQPQNPHPPISTDPSDLPPDPSDPIDLAEEDDDLDCEIIEIDAAELLAQQPHCCEICGKGFKRDANLRMHMRAHGNQFKTLEALLKPPGNEINSSAGRVIRFSCPFAGCNRNRAHQRFRPLKTMPCVKNHFKRSHCPKTYSCNRCNKRNFSVVADLRSHIRHCGDCRWLCSCGTKFSRKDKLLGHVALFEGHMVVEAEDEEKGKGVVFGEEGGARAGAEAAGEAFDLEFFEGMEGFEGIEGIFRE